MRSVAGVHWKRHLDGVQCTQLPVKWNSESSTESTTIQKSFHSPQKLCTEVIVRAWANILSLFTESDDVAFGLVLGSRSGQSIESLRYVPIRLTAPLEVPLSDAIQRTRETLHQVQEHASDRFTDLSDFVNDGTLVQIMRSESDDREEPFNEGLPNLSTRTKITFLCSNHHTTITIQVLQAVHSHQFANELLRQTMAAIDRLTGNSSSIERDTLDLILSWTLPCERLPSTILLHQWVENQCQLTPNAIAIGESERVMTYRELNLGADLLADYLATTWTDHEKTRNVGVFFEKSAYAIVSMLAVLKAGGTYVPLDIAWPQERVGVVLENAQICDVLCSKMQSSHVPANKNIQILRIDDWFIHDLKRPTDKQRAQREIDPATAAYMLYTSGSTGIPKGISVSHRAISTSIQAMARQLNINEATRTFQYTTFTFDLNIADLWMTLGYGGRICLPSEEERLNPDQFIVQERCNYAMITPTAASTIDTTIMHDNLKTLALIGEAVPERLLQKIATPDSSMKLYNTWGPTEACVIASSSEGITCKNGMLSIHPNNVGHSIGATMFLVDPRDPHKLTIPFALGEIALVGRSLASGYYGNDEKTEEAFRRDLEWTRDEAVIKKVGGSDAMETVYLTGDIGRYNPNGDGTILFMYRKEGGYVKINGYRVDPGEIESRILDLANDQLPLKGACVLIHEHSDDSSEVGRQDLVCFLAVGDGKASPGAVCTLVSPSATQGKAIKQIAESLRAAMPEYMIPRLFVPIEALPILTSHKINRKAMSSILTKYGWTDLVQRFGM